MKCLLEDDLFGVESNVNLPDPNPEPPIYAMRLYNIFLLILPNVKSLKMFLLNKNLNPYCDNRSNNLCCYKTW